MGIIKKSVFAQNLETYNTFLLDTEVNSKYFKVTQLPDIFTGGKNGFLIQGSTELVKDTYLMIEIKDSKGRPIYFGDKNILLELSFKGLVEEIPSINTDTNSNVIPENSLYDQINSLY